MHQKTGRVVLACILSAIMATTATADPGAGPQNDAGSGGDAGDVRANATAVQTAVRYAGALRPNDVDWYAAPVGATGASCIVARVQASAPTYFALGAEGGSSVGTAVIRAEPDRDAIAAVAGMGPLTTTLRSALVPGGPNFGSYGFQIDRVGIPAGAGDAGSPTDAGDSAAGAIPVAAGCVHGRLSVLGSVDLRDMYSMQVGAGEVVTYSLAANYDGLSLTLLDALGETVGPALVPGQLATVTTSSPGTHYLSVSRTSAVGDVGYVAAMSLGPEPSGCRPYCVD